MLDENNCRYIYNGKIIELSVLESKILKVLIDNKHRVIKYSELSLELYGTEEKKGGLCSRIQTLRKKLKGILEIKAKTTIGYYIN